MYSSNGIICNNGSVGRLSIEVVAKDGNYQIISLETLRQFVVTFYTFRTHKMKATANLFLRIESAALMFCAVILQHNCFDPGFIAYSCQVLLYTYIHTRARCYHPRHLNKLPCPTHIST